ncbi:MAG: hypothetical protein K1X75_06145 [Leptospirales bacterium]|nr:hypothetical protein [Leptospirales bacterium]
MNRVHRGGRYATALLLWTGLVNLSACLGDQSPQAKATDESNESIRMVYAFMLYYAITTPCDREPSRVVQVPGGVLWDSTQAGDKLQLHLGSNADLAVVYLQTTAAPPYTVNMTTAASAVGDIEAIYNTTTIRDSYGPNDGPNPSLAISSGAPATVCFLVFQKRTPPAAFQIQIN